MPIQGIVPIQHSAEFCHHSVVSGMQNAVFKYIRMRAGYISSHVGDNPQALRTLMSMFPSVLSPSLKSLHVALSLLPEVN